MNPDLLNLKSRNPRSMPMPVPTSLRPFIPNFRQTVRQILAILLVFASVFAIGPTAPLFAQVAAAPMMLHITILDGEDSLNNIRERTAREPIVQVEDENHKPVAGALILFSLQSGGSGAGGTFNGLTSLTATTDAQGRAVAHGLRPNQTAGTYTISVTATLGALVATTVIHQSNVAGGGGGGAPGLPEAPAVPGTPVSPIAPGSPITPGTPGVPGTPAVPGTPGAPGAPTVPGTETTTPTSGGGSTTPVKIRKGIRHIPKKVWITGATVVATGVVVGVVVATRGNNPTTITPGTGTVTGP